MPIDVILLLAATVFQPEIPKVWTEEAVRELEVPLAQTELSPRHISEADYYGIPERKVYRTYPVYHPDREPEGYWQWLHEREPEIAFDPAQLRTREDWIAAGDRVFHAPVSFGPVFFGEREVRDPKFFEATGMPVAADGTVPFASWVVREKGKVELGSMGCNTCHTRVLDDGTVVPGAPSNNPADRQGARMLGQAARFMGPEKILDQIRNFALQFELPGLKQDLNRRARTMSLDELIAAGQAIPAGVTARAFTSMFVPPQIPDLIGVAERHFLDHTGLVRQQGPADLMRYSTLVQDMMGYARYGDAEPMRKPEPGKGARHSDAQLYALALYLYSLQPPPNPHPFDDAARRGKEVFEKQGCGSCHAAPLYTNNKLTPVEGFEPSQADRKKFNVMNRRVGTDPRYALQTKKGTGYYKVPSLKGVWYRGPLEHNGSVATLEDWFDAARLRDDYVPTGFKPADAPTHAVKGHEFGLDLPAQEKADLIAFLRTL
ncbi:MAG: hypothetical protein GC160_12315 [Acidobacteria bacterium]|nr:hypothetical protein [Acidobacteriota bacterium]